MSQNVNHYGDFIKTRLYKPHYTGILAGPLWHLNSPKVALSRFKCYLKVPYVDLSRLKSTKVA